MKNNNPWAIDGKRPLIEMDNDGEWNDEEAKLYDHWEKEYKRDFETQQQIYKNYPNLNATREEMAEFQKLK